MLLTLSSWVTYRESAARNNYYSRPHFARNADRHRLARYISWFSFDELLASREPINKAELGIVGYENNGSEDYRFCGNLPVVIPLDQSLRPLCGRAK
jgi:hypothetical protein